MSFTAVWAIFLPKVKQSLYFHKRKKVDETTIGQSTVTIYCSEKYNEAKLGSVEMPATIEQV